MDKAEEVVCCLGRVAGLKAEAEEAKRKQMARLRRIIVLVLLETIGRKLRLTSHYATINLVCLDIGLSLLFPQLRDEYVSCVTTAWFVHRGDRKVRMVSVA